MSKRFGTALEVGQLSAPANPASGAQLLYPKSDGLWYTKNSGGTEWALVDASTAQTIAGAKSFTGIFTHDVKNSTNNFIWTNGSSNRKLSPAVSTNYVGFQFRNDGTSHTGIRSNGAQLEIGPASLSSDPDAWGTPVFTLTNAGALTLTGSAAIGTSISATRTLNVTSTTADPAADYHGAYVQKNFQFNSGTATGTNLIAIAGVASLSGTFGASGTPRGGQFSVSNTASASVTAAYGLEASISNVGGIIATAVGAEIGISNIGAGATISNAYGLRVTIGATQTGTLTNTYGVYIGDVTTGTQTNQAYGLYQSDTAARNYLAAPTQFGDAVAINGTAVDANVGLVSAKNVTDPAASQTGASFSRTLVLTAAGSQVITGGSFNVTLSANAFNQTGKIYGGQFQFQNSNTATVSDARAGHFIAYNVGAGTITSATAGYFDIQNLVSGGTMTSAYGVRVEMPFNTGTIGSTYGVYVGDITSGTQTNQAYAFYCNDTNARSFINHTLTVANLASTSNIAIAGGSNLNFNASGLAAPTLTTRSAGTKVVLYSQVSPSAADFAIGMESGAMWLSVGDTTNSYKFYGGSTLAATLTGGGALTLVGGFSATSGSFSSTLGVTGAITSSSSIDAAGSMRIRNSNFTTGAPTKVYLDFAHGDYTADGSGGAQSQIWSTLPTSGNSRLEFYTTAAATLNTTASLTIAHNHAATFAGAVTGASFAGVGTSLTDLNASNINSGVVNPSYLPDFQLYAEQTAGTGSSLSGVVWGVDSVTGNWDFLTLDDTYMSATVKDGLPAKASLRTLGTGSQQAAAGNHTHSVTLADLPEEWVKQSCRAGTTGNITLSGTQTIDGVACVAGDRVLVRAQTSAAENGIYVVSAGAWSRAADANTASEIAMAAVPVDEGSSVAGFLWRTTFKPTDTLGTTAMNWAWHVTSGQLGAASGAASLNSDGIVPASQTDEVVLSASGTSGTVTLSMTAGARIFTLTPTGNVTTLSLTNVPTGRSVTVTLIVTQGASAFTIATPSGGVFMGAATPTQVANKKCIFTYQTVDGGTSWMCSGVVQV